MAKGRKFNNRAARRFGDDLSKIDVMSQQEIFDILEEDIKTILDQVTAARNHHPGASWPTYVANGFANLSTALWFYKFAKDHCKVKKGKLKTDLDKEELESFKSILADIYRKSATNFYQKEIQEYSDRNKLLAKAFIRADPKLYKISKKFEGLSKSQRRDLCIQVYGDPIYNMVRIVKIVDDSTIDEKKKLKVLKKMYGKRRFVMAVGAAMTVALNTSDCVAMLYEFMVGLKKKKRAPYVRAYTEAYKRNQSRYFRIDQEFVDKNDDMIDALVDLDIGYKKAFRNLGADSAKKEKDHDYRPKMFQGDKKK